MRYQILFHEQTRRHKIKYLIDVILEDDITILSFHNVLFSINFTKYLGSETLNQLLSFNTKRQIINLLTELMLESLESIEEE